MSIVTNTRQATASELAAEMDRRGAVIEELERRVAQLERALDEMSGEIEAQRNAITHPDGRRAHFIDSTDQIRVDILTDILDRAKAAALGAQPIAPEGWKLVPEAALKWLNGEGPDLEGNWFGDFPDGQQPKGAFWWRSRFAAMLAAAPERIVGAAK